MEIETWQDSWLINLKRWQLTKFINLTQVQEEVPKCGLDTISARIVDCSVADTSV